MPTSPPRACNRCKKPTPSRGPCQCRPAFEGSTHPGNTDTKWRKLSRAYKRSHPQCQATGCMNPTYNVDHIIPMTEQPELKYDWRNLQSLCKPHHDRKTVQDALRGKTKAR
jgi:5-methylcytosine-specific restriction protein A